MKTHKNKYRKLAATSAAGLAMVQAANAATMIVISGGGGTIPSDWASNILPSNSDTMFEVSAGADGTVGTPDIGLTWGGATRWDRYAAWPLSTNGGALQMEDYGQTTAGEQAGTIVFTPGAGFNAIINSVDLLQWAGGGNGAISLTWSVEGSASGVLANGSHTYADNTNLKQSIIPSVTGVGGENLTLTIDLTAGTGSYFAIENLAFDQVAVIPEPSTSLLSVAGLGAMAMRRRRK